VRLERPSPCPGHSGECAATASGAETMEMGYPDLNIYHPILYLSYYPALFPGIALKTLVCYQKETSLRTGDHFFNCFKNIFEIRRIRKI